MNNYINQFPPEVILWGGTGQAKVVRPIIEHYGSKVIAVFDDTPDLAPPFPDIELYCGYESFLRWFQKQNQSRIGFSITIGNPHGRVRISLHEKLKREGLQPITLAHPTASIANNACIGLGTQILAGAIISNEARIGRECIINTKASIDHEDILEDGVEVAPGATLCGAVHIGINGWVCAGATVLPGVNIGEDAVVGAGAIVIEDVPARTTVVGVPAKKLKKQEEK